MKRLLMLAMALFLVSGCAITRMGTSIGIDVGNTFQTAAAKGEVSAEQSIKAWPYVSGLIRGLLAEDYEYKVTPSTQHLMEELDALAMKEKLTNEEKGMVIGYYVRLEYLAGKELWERYGISMWGAVKAFMAGG